MFTRASDLVHLRLDGIIAAHYFSGNRAIDLGCGTGFTTNWLAERGWEVVGVDEDSDAVRTATKNYPNRRFQRIRLSQPINFELQRVDLVVILSLMDYCRETIGLLKATRDLLNPNGLIIVAVTHHSYMKNLVLALTNRFESHFVMSDGNFRNHWTSSTFRKIATKVGLKVTREVHVGRVKPVTESILFELRTCDT